MINISRLGSKVAMERHTPRLNVSDFQAAGFPKITCQTPPLRSINDTVPSRNQERSNTRYFREGYQRHAMQHESSCKISGLSGELSGKIKPLFSLAPQVEHSLFQIFKCEQGGHSRWYCPYQICPESSVKASPSFFEKD